MNFKEYSQEWFEDGQIDEVAFCENFLQRMPLKCINGIFFSYDGMLPDSEVEKEIYRMVKPVLTKGISKKVKQLLEVLKLEAYSEELPVQMDRIHVNNGTYFLNGDFTEKNNIIAFMQSSGYIRLEENTTATSKNLYQAYCRWCEDNTEKPMSAKSFSGYLKENEKKYHIHYSTNIPSDNGKNARGFQGIHTQIRIDSYR